MFCQNCGAKLRDDARYCTECGCPVDEPEAANDSHTASKATPTSNTPIDSPLESQIDQARRKSRRRVPIILIVILVTLAVAGAALAAIYVYQRHNSPATQGGQTTAEQQPNEEQAEQSEANRLEGSKALYNGVLADYQKAQANGWSYDSTSSENASKSWVADVDALSAYASAGTIPKWPSIEGKTFCYAYTDLGNDGISDLVIAYRDPENDSPEDYTVTGIFTSDGHNVYSIINGLIGYRGWWEILPDGLVFTHGSGGYEDNAAKTYTISDGQPAEADSFSVSHDRTPKFMHNGKGISEEEYNELLDARPDQPALEWHAISDFSPVQSEQTNWMDSSTEKRYTAYKTVCEEHISKYGEPTKTVLKVGFSEKTYATGLCLAKLIDFNGDGAEELLLAYCSENELSAKLNSLDSVSYDIESVLPLYTIEVWSYDGKQANCIYEQTGQLATSFDHELDLVLYRDGDAISLLEENGDYSHREDVASTVDSSICSFDGNEFSESSEGHESSSAIEFKWELNGQACTEDEYNQTFQNAYHVFVLGGYSTNDRAEAGYYYSALSGDHPGDVIDGTRHTLYRLGVTTDVPSDETDYPLFVDRIWSPKPAASGASSAD